jgi:hypothetical protein
MIKKSRMVIGILFRLWQQRKFLILKKSPFKWVFSYFTENASIVFIGIVRFVDLTFSKDTIYLDTVLLILASTYRLKVYNKSKMTLPFPL